MLQWKARFTTLLTVCALLAAAAGFGGGFDLTHLGW
jgi:hypothetical protein